MTSFLPESVQKGLFSNAPEWEVYKALITSYSQKSLTSKQQRIIKYQTELKLIDIPYSRDRDNDDDDDDEDEDGNKLKLSSYESNNLFLADNYNRFQTEYIPPNIGLLKNVTSIYIIHQEIDILPASIHNLTKLRVLYIRDAEIDRFPDLEPGQTHVLTHLDYLGVPEDFYFTSEEEEIIRQKNLNVVYVNKKGNPIATQVSPFIDLDSPTTRQQNRNPPVSTNASIVNVREEPIDVEAHYERGGRKSRRKGRRNKSHTKRKGRKGGKKRKTTRRR